MSLAVRLLRNESQCSICFTRRSDQRKREEHYRDHHHTRASMDTRLTRTDSARFVILCRLCGGAIWPAVGLAIVHRLSQPILSFRTPEGHYLSNKSASRISYSVLKNRFSTATSVNTWATPQYASFTTLCAM
jgi:hypothetical protein